jgi:predicted glutamine amidotransferase
MFGFCAARPAAVARALIDEPNALQIQSRDHADGWGIGYYPDGAVAPLVLRSINAAFADTEFAETAGRVSARTVIAHVRRASCGPVSLENTHPFHHDRWMFAHNGTVSRFAEVRASLEAAIDRRLRRLIRGDTDSERCFLLLLSRLLARGPLEEPRPAAVMGTAILETVEMIHTLADVGAAEPSSLTFVLSDGASLVAFRDGRSLHYSLDAPVAHAPGEAINELMVASEVLSAERSWAEVPERGLIGIDDARALYRSSGA